MPILLQGLRALEYRGYDSAGLALAQASGLKVVKKAGRVEVLAQALQKKVFSSHVGIAHTRWATHGAVTDVNAHPHLSSDSQIALVHNGVIENYLEIAQFLAKKGYVSVSQTDTEVLANLIAYHYAKEPEGPEQFMHAVRKSLLHVQGTYGIVALARSMPGCAIGARKGSPLIVGVAKGEKMLASDVSAFSGRAEQVVYLEDGQVVSLTADKVSIRTLDEERVDPIFSALEWSAYQSHLGDFAHFMEKEIFEQPSVLENAMRGRFSSDGSTSKFGGLNIPPADLKQIDRVLFLGCGTSWHACLVAEHLIERYARIPVDVDYASEFRYRNAPLDKNTLVVVISQSGETLDTLEALREAKRKGYTTLAITNVVGSTLAREVSGGIYQHAGLEVGVASTKAFTSQVLLCGMLALYLGRLRSLSYGEGVQLVQGLKAVPDLVTQVLSQAQSIKEIALKYADYPSMLFLGRQRMFPIALEGALKLKEISYIHAEGYPAAEMKHGPIALVSSQCPCVVLAPRDELLPKILANITELKARQARVIAVTSAPEAFPEGLVDDLIPLPEAPFLVDPILAALPLQLFAYFIATARGVMSINHVT